ncbi:MAG TPA: DUF6491 family protein [Rhizomicrobium sp.]|jgi:hypothetical protein|nr:DUF6491 family protein [Rhizomicrobium sp.]
MRKVVFAAFVFGLFAASAEAQPACLQVGRIWSWKPIDKRTLIVEDELHRKFKVGLAGYCPALPYKLTLGFKSNGGIGGLDCLRKGDDVISHDIGIPYTCPVMSIAPYTSAMERADQAAAARKQSRY